MGEFARVCSELGLGAALSAGVFVAFFFLLKWVLGASSEQLRVMAEERTAWRMMQAEFANELKSIQETNRAFHAEVREAHRFQREEHKELSMILGRINGYKDH